MTVRRLLIVVVLWLLALVQHAWMAPLLQRLPADYAEDTRFDARTQARDTPNGAWVHSRLTARRSDQTLVSSATHSIIQGDLHWTNAAGVVEFENTGIYGVDRYSRENLPGYGDIARTGPFLFPLHTSPVTYRYWDPQFIGSREAKFDHGEVIDGMDVSVFTFIAKALDETAGYAHLPNVPERYRVETDAKGTMWIETRSGTLVDYEESGVSFFIDAPTSKRLTEVYIWDARFTAETRARKVAQAHAASFAITAFEVWLPLGLLLAGVAIAVAGMAKKGRARRTPDSALVLPVPGAAP